MYFSPPSVITAALVLATKPRHEQKNNNNGGGKEKCKQTHIVCVDVPSHVSIRNQLPVDVASDFTVSPAAVDVNYADHVPLRMTSKSHETYHVKYSFETYLYF